MADLIFWMAVACCVVAQGAIVRSALRTAGGGSARTVNEGAPMPAPKRGVEIAWTILPAVALALVLVFTWRAIHPRTGAAVGASHRVAAVASTRPESARR